MRLSLHLSRRTKTWLKDDRGANRSKELACKSPRAPPLLSFHQGKGPAWYTAEKGG